MEVAFNQPGTVRHRGYTTGVSNPMEASSKSLCRTSLAALTTAVPVENVAVEPGVMGALGVPSVSADATVMASSPVGGVPGLAGEFVPQVCTADAFAGNR